MRDEDEGLAKARPFKILCKCRKTRRSVNLALN